MSRRQPPTAWTFARLAVASAVACAFVPEVVELTRSFQSPASPVQTMSAPKPGPRVMGSVYTADETLTVGSDHPGIDRFRFAAGTPFGDEPASPGADPQPVPGEPTGSTQAAPDDAVPERVAPATPALGPVKRQNEVGLHEPEVTREAVPSRPSSEPVVLERTTAVPPVSVPEADQAVPPEAAAETAPSIVVPAAVAPPVAKPVEAEDRVATPARRETKPAEAPTQAAKRSNAVAGTAHRARRRSATADGGGSAPKPAWRPENLSNWPN